MKNITSLLILCLGLSLQAQVPNIDFRTDLMLINGIEMPVERSLILGPRKTAVNFYKGFVKSQLDQRLTEDDEVHYASQIMLSEVTDKRGDLILYFFSDQDQIQLAAAYKLGYDVFLNASKHPEEYAAFQKFVRFAALKYYEDRLPDYIDDQEDALKDVEKEKKRAEKDSDRALKSAKKLSKKVSKAKKKLEKETEKLESVEPAKKEEAKLELLELQKEIDQYMEDKNYQEGLSKVKYEEAERLKPIIKEKETALIEAKAQLESVENELGPLEEE